MKTDHAKNTLVVGGGGFIGSHLVPQLIATGRRVTVLGRSPSPRYPLPAGATYVAGDFGHLELIVPLLQTHQEAVHLAYATVPNTSFDNPVADLLQNLPPAVQLFSEAAKRKVKLLLVSSGGTVYGASDNLPVSETHPTKPISPYGVTKLTLDNYAYLYAATHGLEFVCVRPSNAYGAGQRPHAGQGFIATSMASVLNGTSVKIFGQQGTIRDYIYVTDLAAGLVCALERGRLCETYNLGSSVGRSNLGVIDAMRPLMRELGCEITLEMLPERTFDVKANVLDSTKLQLHTGWRPKVEFDEGLRLTREWLQNHHG